MLICEGLCIEQPSLASPCIGDQVQSLWPGPQALHVLRWPGFLPASTTPFPCSSASLSPPRLQLTTLTHLMLPDTCSVCLCLLSPPPLLLLGKFSPSSKPSQATRYTGQTLDLEVHELASSPRPINVCFCIRTEPLCTLVPLSCGNNNVIPFA